MKLRKIIATLSILALGIAVAPNAEAASRYITISADGTVKVVPDAVKIMGQVSVVGGTNKDALASANSASNAVRSALANNKIPPKDIATTAMTIYPEYNYTQDKGSVQVYVPGGEPKEIGATEDA